MARKLFCDLCPLTYELSRWKGIAFRHLQDLRCSSPFARSRREEPLPVLAYRHASLIQRRLGNVDMRLQENKAVNLRAWPRRKCRACSSGRAKSFRSGGSWERPRRGRATAKGS